MMWEWWLISTHRWGRDIIYRRLSDWLRLPSKDFTKVRQSFLAALTVPSASCCVGTAFYLASTSARPLSSCCCSLGLPSRPHVRGQQLAMGQGIMTPNTKWYDTDCPVCSETEGMTRPTEKTRRCGNCGFEWDATLPEWQIIVAARDYARQQLSQTTTTDKAREKM